MIALKVWYVGRPFRFCRPVALKPKYRAIIAFYCEALSFMNSPKKVMIVERKLTYAWGIGASAGCVGTCERKEVTAKRLKHAGDHARKIPPVNADKSVWLDLAACRIIPAS